MPKLQLTAFLGGGLDMVVHAFNSGIWEAAGRGRGKGRGKGQKIRVSKIAQWAKAHSVPIKLQSSERTSSPLALCTVSHPPYSTPFLPHHISFHLIFITQHKHLPFSFPFTLTVNPSQKSGVSARPFHLFTELFFVIWTLGTKIKRNDKFTPPSMHSPLLITKFHYITNFQVVGVTTPEGKYYLETQILCLVPDLWRQRPRWKCAVSSAFPALPGLCGRRRRWRTMESGLFFASHGMLDVHLPPRVLKRMRLWGNTSSLTWIAMLQCMMSL